MQLELTSVPVAAREDDDVHASDTRMRISAV
jgi:hypothetical protein